MSQGSYHLIDSGNFQKLEQVGPYRLVRPSPQAVWRPRLGEEEWRAVDAYFTRFSGGDGKWTVVNQKMREQWTITISDIRFVIRLTDFGHLGIFPEQQKNWATIRRLIEARRATGAEVQVLNLFAYTGGSTLASAMGGAHCAHIDASKTSVSWARENAREGGIEHLPVRWIVEDVGKFVKREVRRGSRYHGIILDPPSYGRGAKGEVWKIEDHLIELLDDLKAILADDYLFILLSSHSNGYTPQAMENLLRDIVDPRTGQFVSEEMLLHEDDSRRALPSGASSLFHRGMPGA